MKIQPIVNVARFVCISIMVIMTPSRSADSNEYLNWKSVFPAKGPIGQVWTMDVSKGRVVVGGTITGADQIAANGIALWDGAKWTTLGNGLGVIGGGYPELRKVRFSEEDVFAIGTIKLDGQFYGAAQWNGAIWAFWKMDSNDYAFDILRWEGHTLFGTTKGVVEADGPVMKRFGSNLQGPVSQFGLKGSELWASGKFILGPDSTIHNFARWTGSAWSGLPVPKSAPIRDFAWHGDDLFAIESYQSKQFQPDSQAIVKWSGTEWLSIPTSTAINEFQSMESDQKRLLLSGWKRPEGTGFIERWDGKKFELEVSFGNPFQWLFDLKLDAQRVYLSGAFSGIGALRAEGIAVWEGGRWNALSNATNLGPSTIAPLGSPKLGSDGRRLYFGCGCITYAGENPAGGVASWDGQSMDALAGGLKTGKGRQPPYMKITSFAFSENKLYAGGVFDSAGNKETRNIAVWDGLTWQPLGLGYPGRVHDILSTGKDVYVSGVPDTLPAPGSNPLLIGRSVGKWTGIEWQPFGQDIKGPVGLLASYKEEIYLSGTFTIPNDTGLHILARWDGKNWSSVIRYMDEFGHQSLHSMVTHQGDLFISGDFLDPKTGKRVQLAKWNGSSLSGFDSIRAYSGPGQMVSDQGRLFLAGNRIGRNERLIYWDGTEWHSIAEDDDFYPLSMAVFGGDLYVQGYIPNFEGVAYYGLAKWSDPKGIPVLPPKLGNPSRYQKLAFRQGTLRVLFERGGKVADLQGKIFPPAGDNRPGTRKREHSID